MDKQLKGIVIAASAMVVAGLLLAGVGFMAGGNQPIRIDKDGFHIGNEKDASGGKKEVIEEELDSFSSIRSDLDIYKVELIPSDKYAIEAAYDSKFGKPNYKIENDTLIIEEAENKKFRINVDIMGLDVFSNHPDDLGVKIYYPKTAKLKDITIRGGASDLAFDKISAETAEFDLDFGKLDLSDLSAKKVIVKLDSGDCSLKNITADDLNIDNSLGKTTLEGADLKTLKIRADSGDVSITGTTVNYGDLQLDLGKLTAKEMASKGLQVKNGGGDVELQGTLLGTTDVTCDMGRITVATNVSKDQYNYELNTNLGAVSIGGDQVSNSIASSNQAGNTLKLTNDAGDIKVNFD